MIPAAFANFLSASTQASAALIGLLFVAVSLAPERVFGPQAHAERQAVALRAFSALGNAFFISLFGLIPGVPLGPMVIVVGLLGLSQALGLLRLRPRWQRERRLARGLTMVLLSAAIYGSEIATGVLLGRKPLDTTALTTRLYLLVAAYVLGLTRAWDVLGAPRGRGLLTQLEGRLLTQLGLEGRHDARQRITHAPEEGAAATADGAQEQDLRQGQAVGSSV